MKRAYWPTLLTLCLILYGCAANTGPSTTPTAETAADTDGGRDLIRWIPVTDDSGATTKMEARICRPDDAAPAHLVVINHGSPPHADERPTMQLEECSQRAVRWFVDRGFVVVEALRRGYGATGGVWAEGYGSCEDPDYVRAGLETARDIGAVVTYATALPFVIPDGVTVVGQSAGGWGTIAYDSVPHSRVAAFVVMAGGRGGHHRDIANNNCRPDLLAQAAGQFGRTATTPMLWIYAENDSFFGPPVANSLLQAFTASGGLVDFHRPGPYGQDGHHLFFGKGGTEVWGPLIKNYLVQRGALSQADWDAGG
ncbi:dienelactone hydrolase family protein [Acidisoma sp. S159]|uniref:dienelactone hydrolase family protein n=1 Tax=Acidisoma sp. S159 TaxID=1747225 RepID=UPI001C20A509|nr:CocE/NonD family hydrolase [Acidisoma sp. S159]